MWFESTFPTYKYLKMINLTTIIIVLFTHWIGDFILQTQEEAENKSKSNKYLTDHVLTYTFIWFSVGIVWFISGPFRSELFVVWKGGLSLLLFTLITFTTHWIIDYFTSRLNSKLYKKGDIHNLFVSIGFDQVLHYIQLFTAIYLLT